MSTPATITVNLTGHDRKLEAGDVLACGSSDLIRVTRSIWDTYTGRVTVQGWQRVRRRETLTYLPSDRVEILAHPVAPLPAESTPAAAGTELKALGGTDSLAGHLAWGAAQALDERDAETEHTSTWLDWAAQVRAMGYSWEEALEVARVWYFG